MSDNLQNKGPQDRKRINTSEKWELNYWCKELGISEEKLREAVSSVGSMVEDVKKYINRR